MVVQKKPRELEEQLLSLCGGGDPERTGTLPMASFRDILRSANLGAPCLTTTRMIDIGRMPSSAPMHGISMHRRADASADPFGSL